MASSAANRSNTSPATSFARASGRSTLLITTIGRSPSFKRLRDDELGLRQRPLGGVDQHQRAVHHAEDALHLAAEIGVARRVDDVDAGLAPLDRGRLGEDRDAALALQIVGIHRALGDALVLAERAGLLQQPVDQRGLAMVDVGDDRDVAQRHERSNGFLKGSAATRAGRARHCGAIYSRNAAGRQSVVYRSPAADRDPGAIRQRLIAPTISAIAAAATRKREQPDRRRSSRDSYRRRRTNADHEDQGADPGQHQHDPEQREQHRQAAADGGSAGRGLRRPTGTRGRRERSCGSPGSHAISARA